MWGKYCRLFVIMCVLCLSSCSHNISADSNTLRLNKALDEMEKSLPSDRRSITNGILKNVASTLSQRYNMKCTGFGGGWCGDKILSLVFTIHRTVEKGEARVMLVDCVQGFISNVNSNEALKPYLDGLVFTEKNIRLTIFVKDSQGSRVYYPDICVFGSVEGGISYKFQSPEKKYGYVAKEHETFQEALSILKEENKDRSTQLASKDISITQQK